MHLDHMSSKLELKKNKEILKEIKRVIMDVAKEMGIEIDKIILFGSRARGHYKEDSDWDILVVTRRKLDRKTKIKLIIKIHKELVKRFLEPFDVVTLGRDEKLHLQFIQTILKEGVII